MRKDCKSMTQNRIVRGSLAFLRMVVMATMDSAALMNHTLAQTMLFKVGLVHIWLRCQPIIMLSGDAKMCTAQPRRDEETAAFWDQNKRTNKSGFFVLSSS
jgi:hypothetical protein